MKKLGVLLVSVFSVVMLASVIYGQSVENSVKQQDENAKRFDARLSDFVKKTVVLKKPVVVYIDDLAIATSLMTKYLKKDVDELEAAQRLGTLRSFEGNFSISMGRSSLGASNGRA